MRAEFVHIGGMTGDQVNAAIALTREFIGKGRLRDALALLDSLPIAVQASPPILELRKQARPKPGRKPKRVEPPLASEAEITAAIDPGIHFQPIAGAGFAGFPAFRCKAPKPKKKAGPAAEE